MKTCASARCFGVPSINPFASKVDRLGSDRTITGVSMLARKQPHIGLSAQSAPVLPEFAE